MMSSVIARTRAALGLASVCLLAACLGAAADDKPDTDGWVNLLAGGKLESNWTTKGNWSLDKDGVVKLEPRKGETGWQRYDAYLWSRKQYKDFEVDFEYKVQKDGNSGFYFRVGDLKKPVENGIEVQIYDSGGKPRTPS